MLILKGGKSVCFFTLFQVLILKWFVGCLSCPETRCEECGSTGRHCPADFGTRRKIQQTGWCADFMNNDSTGARCCQLEYIDIKLSVRTNGELIGTAAVTRTEDRGGETMGG